VAVLPLPPLNLDKKTQGMSQPKTALTLKASLRAQALRLLARKDYSRHELQAKLSATATLGLDEMTAESEGLQLVKEVLDALEQAAWLSDSRTAEVVVHSRQQRGLGMRRIAQDLKRKGIADATIAVATADLAATESERAFALLSKRHHHQRTQDTNATALQIKQQWQKQYQFLIRRGFSSEAARRALLQLGQSHPTDGQANDEV
jgi:regulatory protein